MLLLAHLGRTKTTELGLGRARGPLHNPLDILFDFMISSIVGKPTIIIVCL